MQNMHTMQDVGLPDDDQTLPRNETGLDVWPAMLNLLDELAYGVIVISAQGRILHANRAARRKLDQGVVLGADQGELKVLSPLDAKAFQCAIGQAAIGKRSLIGLGIEGADSMLAVVPLQGRAGVPCERIALFLSRADVCESGVLGSFARSLGLTRTEEQVLVLLCRSLSTPDIAAHMSVAVSTVRSHVRSLCAKTASSGVRELVNRVATLPPIAPLPPGAVDLCRAQPPGCE